jgi:predicted MPP superfamily phosphohydrolase
MRLLIIVTLFIILFTSCKKTFRYNSSEIRLEEKHKDLNSKSISSILSAPVKDSFNFLVITDSQRSYNDLDEFVQKANSYSNISFVVLNGDITDFGLQTEYVWIAERMKKLSSPFLAVIGNHDMLGNGREIYKQMFGAENFSFSYSGYRFVLLNSNSREAKPGEALPDTTWLRKELMASPPSEKIFVFAHIPPFGGDFSRTIEPVYAALLTNNGRVLYSIHGHEGISYLSLYYGAPVYYLGINSLNKRNYAFIHVNKDEVRIEQLYF